MEISILNLKWSKELKLESQGPWDISPGKDICPQAESVRSPQVVHWLQVHHGTCAPPYTKEKNKCISKLERERGNERVYSARG